MNETFKELFYNKLGLDSMTLDMQRDFLKAMSDYLDHGRSNKNNGRTLQFVAKQLSGLITFLECLDYNQEEIVRIITNFPSILNTVEDLYNKYLLLGVVENSVENNIRRDKLLNKTKEFMVGFNKIYARYKLICEAGYGRIGWNALVHASDREFSKIFVYGSYRKSYQLFSSQEAVIEWLKNVDATECDIESLKTLDVNKELVSKYEKRTKGIS